jgi:predicted RND superfamily exporter protein
MRMLNRAFNSDDPAQERIPDTRPGVTELLFMIPKNELQRFTTVNHGRANVVVRTGEVGSSHVLRLVAEIEKELAGVDFPEGITARVTGNAILLARSADGIATGQPISVAIAALTIFVLVAVGLRSVRLGIVAMIPNILPVLIYFGLLGLGAAPLSLPTSLIGCMALGIAIDDTVHYVVRYRAERHQGAGPRDAAKLTTRFIGRPVAISSIVLSLGFLVVTLSDFATLQEFGFLSALTMQICLACDLILLPAVLVRARL